MDVFIGLHCLLPEAATRVEVFCKKKSTLNNFVNVIGKHLCRSLFLIKLQAWRLFWRTSANDCFYTVPTPLSIRFTLYSAPSSSSVLLLLRYPMFVFRSHSKGIKVFESGISFSISHFHWFYFLFPCFFCLCQFCFIFSCHC